MKRILIPAILLLASCSDEHQPEAPAPTERFEVKALSNGYYYIAYTITDRKTGRVYLMNTKGGAPLEVQP